MLALALCSVGGVVTLMSRLATGPAVEQKRKQLSAGDTSEAYPAISPDGKRIAYSQRESSKVSAFHVFVRELPAGKPLQITQGEASDVAPVWSPDGGSLAFVRIAEGQSQAIVIPADGGAERKIAALGSVADLAQPLPGVSWDAAGKSLVVAAATEKQSQAIAVVTLGAEKLVRITNPPENESDSTPTVAPAGDILAFVRHTQNGGADIWVCDLSGGGLRRVTFDDKAIRGIAWTRDAQELIYSGSRVGGWRLWRVPAFGGSPKDVAIAGKQAYYPTLGRNRLAYTDSPTVSAIWRATLTPGAAGEGTASDERAVLRSTGRESSAAWSPDGSRIANISDESGADEIVVSDAEGRNRVQVTQLKGARIGRVQWAPNGQALIYDASSDHGNEVFTVPPAPGKAPARVLLNATNASYSHDGKWIYFQSRGQIWKASPDGANPQALVQMNNVGQPVESADGKYVYFRARRSFWRVPASGGEAEEAIVPEHDVFWGASIQPTKKGVYYAEFERSSRGMAVSFYDFTAKRSSLVLRMKNSDFGGGSNFSVSPDGKYILYPRVDQSQTNLMLVENFK